MSSLETKLKSSSFWLKLGIVNHSIALLVITFGCVYSGFSCQGEMMKEVLSVYAFTLFTPQLAIEVILLLALFLMNNSWRKLKQNRVTLSLFLVTMALLLLFVFLK